MGKQSSVEADYARLTVKVELGDSRSFEEQDFQVLVQEAVRSVLGSFGPDFKVVAYDSTTKKGSIVSAGSDIQQIWAALSSFGLFFNRRVAVHFNSLTEYTGVF